MALAAQAGCMPPVGRAVGVAGVDDRTRAGARRRPRGSPQVDSERAHECRVCGRALGGRGGLELDRGIRRGAEGRRGLEVLAGRWLEGRDTKVPDRAAPRQLVGAVRAHRSLRERPRERPVIDQLSHVGDDGQGDDATRSEAPSPCQPGRAYQRDSGQEQKE